MSAEVLREAAALMRQRAEGTAPGPWEVDFNHPFSDDVVGVFAPADKRYTVNFDDLNDQPIEDAYYIASWHPAVALAVADWLDEVAEDWEAEGGLYPHLPMNAARPALFVARAYLGREA